MQTINTPQQPVSSNVTAVPENRIIARVVLQVWGGRKGNDAVFDSEREVDVTDAVLLLDHDFLIGLQDATDQADEIGHAHVNHSGPLEVYVTSSICQFFGVDSMEDITLAALEDAQRTVNPKKPEYVRTTVQMEVTAKVLPGGDRDTAFDSLSVNVSSSSESVIVTRAVCRKPAAEHAPMLPAANPSLPRFMQLITLANAVSVNDGALLTNWYTSPWIGEPTNEVLRFAWTEGSFGYSVTLTEEGIEAGVFDGQGLFHVDDQEGTDLFVRLFKVDPIGLSNLSSVH